eukprot:TRINITY_DN9106_c0_g1::TRINITY_DN9106_c0_g1_i1::g.18189::m.18189 TRINITY_DN9106_c0_g1::TRINITY_DN9106_c0_g1_i1::g.18189  ORF type:complete len:270 (+),score=60.21,sp/Q54KS4/GNL3_DICDI/36.46/7e-08,GN3L_Grn1/PF08701.6/2.7e-10,DUF2076/PF09849.4/2.9e+03,DUF2076/PF09849.4/0.2,DUF2457/PF10446.4/73,DUF2457/PF10446.4/0.14 TRINITY_DN9106_c0_g1_i1:47-856(+)
MGRVKKYKSRRMSLHQKYKVIKKVAQHTRKQRRLAKKNPLSTKSKQPTIPTDWSIRDELIGEALEAKEQERIHMNEVKARRRQQMLQEKQVDPAAKKSAIQRKSVVDMARAPDPVVLCASICAHIQPEILLKHYKIATFNDNREFLENIARKHGMMLKGGLYNMKFAAEMVVKDFLNGKLHGGAAVLSQEQPATPDTTAQSIPQAAQLAIAQVYAHYANTIAKLNHLPHIGALSELSEEDDSDDDGEMDDDDSDEDDMSGDGDEDDDDE